MKPPAFSVDRHWLERLATGGGRDETLNGMQRHFVRVVDGEAGPVSPEETDALAAFQKMFSAWSAMGRRPDASVESKPQPITKPKIAPSTPNPNQAAQEVVTPPTPMSPAKQARLKALRLRAAEAGAEGAKREAQQARLMAGMTFAGKALKQTGLAAKGGLRAAGDAMDRVVHAQDDVRRKVDGSLKVSGRAVQETGSSAAAMAKEARAAVGRAGLSTREALEKQAARMDAEGRGAMAGLTRIVGRGLTAAAEGVGKAAAGATELAAMAVSAAGEKTAKHSKAIGATVAGGLVGAAGMVGGATDSVAVSEADVRGVRQELKVAGRAYAEKRAAYQAALKQKFPSKRERLMEHLTISGLTMASIVASWQVPDEIAAAYAAAYPVESGLMDFRDKVQSLSSGDELEGLLSSVKGKLFEMRYVEELNAGGLPEGWHAELATRATQPGWDFRVMNEHGVVQEVISAKATEHVGYINEALRRYPDIDVVTTSEVYAAMAGTPEGASLIDGGINHVDLVDATQAAASGSGGLLDATVLSALALGPAAYVHFLKSDKPISERAASFAGQAGRAKTATMAGSAMFVAVPFWPVAFLGAMGISMAASVGNNRREQLRRLEAMRDQVRGKSRAQHEKLLALNAPRRPALR
jgi:hypothetical protein